VRLPRSRRRELHEAFDLALGRRRPGALVQGRARHEVRAHGAQVLVRTAVLLLPLVAVLAACGGDTLALDPVAQAADATTKAGSEHVEFVGLSTVQGQQIRMTGSGDFGNNPQLGRMTLRFDAGGKTGELTEITKGWRIYMTSPLFDSRLPSGKKWLSLDLQKAGKSAGLDFGSMTAQTPGQTLQQLK